MTGEEIRLALRGHIMDWIDETGGEWGAFIEPVNGDFIHVVQNGDECYFRLALMPVIRSEAVEPMF